MNAPGAALEALARSDAALALKELSQLVRAQPQDARLRTFLFQLLCVLGHWDRALTQLQLVGELDAAALPMVQTYREAIACETLRAQIFAGQKVPMLFGEPTPWLALLIEALLREGRGEVEAGASLRAQALEQAPATAGSYTVAAAGGADVADGAPAESAAQRFAWIADADTRLGPTLEAVINGRYCWLPFERLLQVRIEPPADLRDAVWMPAQLQFINGGEVVALIPTRYPGTVLATGDALALARRTEWVQAPGGLWTGLGQRLLGTDVGELSLMDLRTLTLEPADNAGFEADAMPGAAPAPAA